MFRSWLWTIFSTLIRITYHEKFCGSDFLYFGICQTVNISDTRRKDKSFVWNSWMTINIIILSCCLSFRTFISPHSASYHLFSLYPIHLDNDGSTFHPILHLKRDNIQLSSPLFISLLCSGTLWAAHVCFSRCYINFGLEICFDIFLLFSLPFKVPFFFGQRNFFFRFLTRAHSRDCVFWCYLIPLGQRTTEMWKMSKVKPILNW